MCPCSVSFSAGDRSLDPEAKGKWDEDWDKSKGGFPFSEKLGEISDKIGSTIDDTINKFRKKDRDDSPDRIRYVLPVATFNTIHAIHFVRKMTDHTMLDVGVTLPYKRATVTH